MVAFLAVQIVPEALTFTPLHELLAPGLFYLILKLSAFRPGKGRKFWWI